MEYVPSFLRKYSMIHITDLYNQTFDTDLSTDEFHARLDDYMKSSKTPKETKKMDNNVIAFLREHPSIGDSSDSIFLLSKYEEWRKEKEEQVAKELFEAVDPLIGSFDGFLGCIHNFEDQVSRMWRFI